MRHSACSKYSFPKLAFLFAPVVWALPGCGLIKMIGIQTAPQSEKVEAEFERMPGHDVLVYVWAPPEIMWDYPKIRLDLAATISAHLEKNVKRVKLIDPFRVEAYLEKARRADREPRELADEFKANMVVHVSVYSFSTRDPGMAHFYRGRMGGSVVVHDLSAPNENQQRIPLKDVSVIVPEEGAVGYHDISPDQVRQATYEAFTTNVGKKFHDYERPLD